MSKNEEYFINKLDNLLLNKSLVTIGGKPIKSSYNKLLDLDYLKILYFMKIINFDSEICELLLDKESKEFRVEVTSLNLGELIIQYYSKSSNIGDSEEMTPLVKYSLGELQNADLLDNPDNKSIVDGVMQLIKAYDMQDKSNSDIKIRLFNKLIKYESLAPRIYKNDNWELLFSVDGIAIYQNEGDPRYFIANNDEITVDDIPEYILGDKEVKNAVS